MMDEKKEKPTQGGKITFKRRDFKGSRYRCLQLTSMGREDLRSFLARLVEPHATIPSDFVHFPKGFLDPGESVLDEREGYPYEIAQKLGELKRWWLNDTSHGRIPNWDLVSTCEISGKRGLVLVEAKAHEGEFKGDDDRTGGGDAPAAAIRNALDRANIALNQVLDGFDLSADSHYQLSNRIAFAWRLSSHGIPVVLVYLGFLDAMEMGGKGRTLLQSAEQWERCVKGRGNGRVPDEAWERTLMDGDLTLLIRSARVSVFCEIVG